MNGAEKKASSELYRIPQDSKTVGVEKLNETMEPAVAPYLVARAGRSIEYLETWRLEDQKMLSGAG